MRLLRGPAPPRACVFVCVGVGVKAC
jgi:hypothetical protein